MSISNQNWHIKRPDPDALGRIRSAFGLSRPIAAVLCNRGIAAEEVMSFFQPKLRDLTDPLEIPGMPQAVARIWDAIHREEKILIHGDFDADGITATALMAWVLSENGARVDCYLPHRIDDGYGLSPESLAKCLDGHRLVLTVDCGITSVEGAALARERGIDLIITDHHQPGEEMPEAHTIINPKLMPDRQDLNVLAGVGVCFKVCHGFLKYGREQEFGGHTPDLRDGMDLVALGTVADIVPLHGENRCLVRYGMQVLSSQRRPGIHALCGIAGIRDQLRTEDIAFRLAPRLNAAGRMGDANEALKLLQCESIIEAHDLARNLDRYNRQRQDHEEETYQAAREQINEVEAQQCHSLVVRGDDWHRGVIGIVASRLAQEFNRPAIVLALDDAGELHGSGRSVPGVNLVEMLESCREHLIRFGGHPMAVGLAMATDCYDAFTEQLETAICQLHDGTPSARPALELESDAHLADLSDSFFSEIEMLAPFGHENPAPVFMFPHLRTVRVAAAGANSSRGSLGDHNGNRINFIYFGQRPNQLPPGPWDVAAIPEMNFYNGTATPQLNIQDIRPAT